MKRRLRSPLRTEEFSAKFRCVRAGMQRRRAFVYGVLLANRAISRYAEGAAGKVMQTILKRGTAYTHPAARARTRPHIIRVARSIRAELCNLHTGRMEIRVSRAQSRNCRPVYSILHRPSMIQLSRWGPDVVVSDRLYPAYIELRWNVNIKCNLADSYKTIRRDCTFVRPPVTSRGEHTPAFSCKHYDDISRLAHVGTLWSATLSLACACN